MPEFQLRCPGCDYREFPFKDTPIECPRCGEAMFDWYEEDENKTALEQRPQGDLIIREGDLILIKLIGEGGELE